MLNIQTIKLLVKTYGFWIDFAFYFCLLFGIILTGLIGSWFDISVNDSVIGFLVIFIPILCAKLAYQMKKAKLKNQDFYNERE